MTVIVEYNAETYEELFQPIIEAHPGLLGGLADDFKKYIESERLKVPEYFGCDVPYLQPISAYRQGLMHIHLAIPPFCFPKGRPQSDRKCPNDNDPLKDAALVYAQGLYEDSRYSLLAILHPGAHGKSSDKKMMNYLIDVAKRFRDIY